MQALEEYRKPRDALLILVSDYIRICAPRLEELEEAPLPPRYTVPELLDTISVNVRMSWLCSFLHENLVKCQIAYLMRSGCELISRATDPVHCKAIS